MLIDPQIYPSKNKTSLLEHENITQGVWLISASSCEGALFLPVLRELDLAVYRTGDTPCQYVAVFNHNRCISVNEVPVKLGFPNLK